MTIARQLGMTTAGMLVIASAAMADPIIDGTRDGSYGSALAIQNNQTGFGDSNLGLIDWANGSELDGAYARVRGGVLYLMLTGNLESNYNKLELFFDTTAGGQNQLRGDNPDVDFNGLNRMGNDGSGNGMRFDNGFEADFYMTVTGGDIGGGNYGLFSNWAQVLTGGGGIGRYLGQGGAGTDGTLSGGDNPDGIRVTINNSNTGGVGGGSGLDNGDGVFTGIELAINLNAIGAPTGSFNVMAFINGGGHDYLANQVLGGLGGLDNLGEPRFVDFSQIDGLQYFTIPAPSAFALLGLGGLVATSRRRRI